MDFNLTIPIIFKRKERQNCFPRKTKKNFLFNSNTLYPCFPAQVRNHLNFNICPKFYPLFQRN